MDKLHTGKQGCCVECKRAYKRAHRLNNLSSYQGYEKKSRLKRREAVNAASRLRRLLNPEYFKCWLAANRDRKQACDRQYYLENRKRISRYRKEWAKRNPDRVLIHNRNKRARRRFFQRGARVGVIEWERIKSECGFRCVYCFKTTNLSMDHVVPLSAGGKHSADNIVPACRSCNSKKRDLPLIVFLARRNNECKA